MMQQRRYVIPHYKVRHIINVCWLNGSTYAGQRVFEVKADNADNSHIRKCVESRDSTRYLRKGVLCFTPWDLTVPLTQEWIWTIYPLEGFKICLTCTKGWSMEAKFQSNNCREVIFNHFLWQLCPTPWSVDWLNRICCWLQIRQPS